MIRRIFTVLILTALASAPIFALSPGDEVIVPAAGRGDPWGTDMYVMNPGDSSVSVEVAWLVRGQANPNPMTISFILDADETEVLDDVIFNDFGVTAGNGAFLVTADGEVIVNTRIFATDGSETFGQGFEGVPTWAATATGDSTAVVGLSFNSAFRTNIYATAGADGATMMLSLLDAAGSSLATASVTLAGWEPYLRRVDQVFANLQNFDDATLYVSVSAGSAVVGASKVDNATTDPTTLESAASGGGGGSVDGTYQFALYDSASFAAGGNLVVADGVVTAINGTYFNWDKLDGASPACTLIFLWGLGLVPSPIEDFETGVSFSDSYQATGSGVMTWDVEFDVDNNMSLTGSVTAVGSDFPAEDAGCNGDFPPLTMFAGKSN